MSDPSIQGRRPDPAVGVSRPTAPIALPHGSSAGAAGAGNSLVHVAYASLGHKPPSRIGLEPANLGLIDVDTAAIIIGAIKTGLTTEQVKTGVEGIKLNVAQKQELAKKIKEQTDAAVKKAEEAKKAAEEQQMLSWIIAAAAVVGAIAMTAVTAGAGAPVAAVVVMGVLSGGTALLTVADTAVKEAGTPTTDAMGQTKQLDLSFGGMVDAIVAQQLHDGTMVEVRTNADGKCVDKDGNLIEDPRKNPKAGVNYMTTDELQDWKMGWSITANVLVAAAMIASGGAATAASSAAKAGAKAAGDAAVKAAGTFERAGQATALTADVTAASTSIYSGKKTMEVAEIDRDTARAKAQAKFLQTLLKATNDAMGLQQDTMRVAMNRLAENYQALSSMVAAVNTNRKLIARINVS